MVVILRCRKGKTAFQHAFDTLNSTVSGILTQYVFLILTIKNSYSMLIRYSACFLQYDNDGPTSREPD